MIGPLTAIALLAVDSWVGHELSRFPPRWMVRAQLSHLRTTKEWLEDMQTLAVSPDSLARIEADLDHCRALYRTWDLLDDAHAYGQGEPLTYRRYAVGRLDSLRHVLGDRHYMGGCMPRPQWVGQ